MSEKSDLNLNDLKAFSTEELLEGVWPACNLATLLIVAGKLPLMITDLRTGRRCTLSELRSRYKLVTISAQPRILNEFSLMAHAGYTQSDIDAFEAEYPEVAKVLREKESDVPKEAIAKSKDRCRSVREVMSKRLQEAGDEQDQVCDVSENGNRGGMFLVESLGR